MTAETTPAIKRAAPLLHNVISLLPGADHHRVQENSERVAHAILAAALDVEEMARALMPTLDGWWCGDHVEYHETDDDGEPKRCCIEAREEQARDQATALCAALIGGAR